MQTKWTVSIVMAVGVAFAVEMPTATAQNGQWTWGTPGWSYGFELRHVENALTDAGLADPNRKYWTPHVPGSGAPSSVYTGVPDTGYQNTYAVNHDINTAAGYYWEIASPLAGSNLPAIGASLASMWESVQETTSEMWGSLNDSYQATYDAISEIPGYFDPTFDFFDNAFDFTFDGYEFWGGGGGGTDIDDDGPPDSGGGCDTDFLCPNE